MLRIDRIENIIFCSNTYVLRINGSQDVWLVDCGDMEKVLQSLDADERICGVLVTHAHFDHIYGIPILLEKFPKCILVTNEWGVKALNDDKLNLSRYHGVSVQIESTNVNFFLDGDTIPLFSNVIAAVYETPGHNPSCLTYKVQDYFFTGDAYIPNTTVVTNLPYSDKEVALSSYQRIVSLLDEDVVVCSGHGDIENKKIKNR